MTIVIIFVVIASAMVAAASVEDAVQRAHTATMDKISALDKRLDEISVQMESLTRKASGANNELGHVAKAVARVVTGLSEVSSDVNAVDRKLSTVVDQLSELPRRRHRA